MAGSNDPLGLQQLLDASKDDSGKSVKDGVSKKRRSRTKKSSKKAGSGSNESSSSCSAGTKPRKEKRKKLKSSSSSEGPKVSSGVRPGAIPKLPKAVMEPVVPSCRSDLEMTQLAKSLHKIPSKKSQKANWERLGRQVAARPLVAEYTDVWDVRRVRGMRRAKYMAQVDKWGHETSVLFNQRVELEKVCQARLVDVRFNAMWELQDEMPELFNFFKVTYEPEGW